MSGEATLVRMANQIARAFGAYPHGDAVTEVRGHIKAYWTPKMRAEISARAAADPGGLDPVAVEAVSAFGPAPTNPQVK